VQACKRVTPESFADIQKVRQWKVFLDRAGLTVEEEPAEVATFIAGFGGIFVRHWLASGSWK